MTAITVTGRVLTASAEDRTITGLLLPYGEQGSTSAGKITASAGCVTIPDDVSTVHLNIEHDYTRPVGKATDVVETDAGLVATFAVARTRAGDDLLEEAAAGLRACLSVEVDGPVIRAGKLVAGALTGAGAVVRPAFPSAQLVAADAGDLPEDEQVVPEEPAKSAAELLRNALELIEENTTEGDEPETQEEDTMADTATVQAGSLAARHTSTKNEPVKAEDAFRMIAAAFRGGSERQLRAALANVVHDDGDADGDGLGEIAAAPEWLGEVWSQVAYVRKWIPLLTTGPLTSFRQKGFHFGTKPLVQKYAGNKAEVPSNGMTATPVDFETERWAHAADLDRRFFDFGDTDVVRAFVEAQLESYRRETDLDVHDKLFATAATFTPGTVPTDINAGLAAIVDGALALIGDDLNPTFAVVGIDLYRSMLLTPKDKVTEYISSALGLEEGTLDGFRIRPSGRPAAAGKVLVGDGSTVRFREFGGGTPVRVDAEHVSHGGRDLGLFGYTSFQKLTPAGVDGVVVADLVP